MRLPLHSQHMSWYRDLRRQVYEDCGLPLLEHDVGEQSPDLLDSSVPLLGIGEHKRVESFGATLLHHKDRIMELVMRTVVCEPVERLAKELYQMSRDICRGTMYPARVPISLVRKC
jgi:hypothetical protein